MKDLWSTARHLAGWAVGVMAWPGAAQASDWTLGAHLYSLHTPAHDWQRSDTPGLYVRHSSGATVGGFRNTLGRQTLYAAWTSPALGPVEITAGLMTGYQMRDGLGVSNARLAPLLALSVAGPVLLGVTPRLSVLPRASGMNSTVWHLSVEAAL